MEDVVILAGVVVAVGLVDRCSIDGAGICCKNARSTTKIPRTSAGII